MQLGKLTTRYIAKEDRFLISAETDRGNINLWLTQRLLKSLLPHLLEWLEAQTPPEQAASASLPAAEGQNSGAIPAQNLTPSPQVASQLVAQTQPPVTQVDAAAASESTLVQTIQFQPRGGTLRLIFELPDEPALLMLQPEHLRIWLGALYTGWQQADWPDLWPDWMKQAQRLRSQHSSALIH
ncbi:MAG: hypothetical protein SVU24_10580 [Pseudomonadota bacterium]|jgi:hypothetical protein|nr:hypothetical protein [Pseudomonadota bacterium]